MELPPQGTYMPITLNACVTSLNFKKSFIDLVEIYFIFEFIIFNFKNINLNFFNFY